MAEKLPPRTHEENIEFIKSTGCSHLQQAYAWLGEDLDNVDPELIEELAQAMRDAPEGAQMRSQKRD